METKLIKRVQKFKVGGFIPKASDGVKLRGDVTFDDILNYHKGTTPNGMLDAKQYKRLWKAWNGKGRDALLNQYQEAQYNKAFEGYDRDALVNQAVNKGGVEPLMGIVTSEAPGSEGYNKIYTDYANGLSSSKKAELASRQAQANRDKEIMMDKMAELKLVGDSGDLDTVTVPKVLPSVAKPDLFTDHLGDIKHDIAKKSKWTNNQKRAIKSFKVDGYDFNNIYDIARFQHANGLKADGLIGKDTWAALNKATKQNIDFNVAPVKPAGGTVTPPAGGTPPPADGNTGDFPVARKYNVTIGGKSESLTREDAINKHGQGIVKYLDDADSFYDNPDDYLTESTYHFNFRDNNGKAQALNFNINGDGTYTLGEGKTAEKGIIPKGEYDNNGKLRNFSPWKYNIGYSIPAVSNMMNIRSKSNYNRK